MPGVVPPLRRVRAGAGAVGAGGARGAARRGARALRGPGARRPQLRGHAQDRLRRRRAPRAARTHASGMSRHLPTQLLLTNRHCTHEQKRLLDLH